MLGQNVNAYSSVQNKKDWNLARLIREVANLEGIRRLRYMTSHPVDMSDDLIRGTWRNLFFNAIFTFTYTIWR